MNPQAKHSQTMPKSKKCTIGLNRVCIPLHGHPCALGSSSSMPTETVTGAVTMGDRWAIYDTARAALAIKWPLAGLQPKSECSAAHKSRFAPETWYWYELRLPILVL